MNTDAASRRLALSSLGFYLIVSIMLFGLPVIGSPATAHVGYTKDPAMMMWFLAWWPYALWNHINPFITHAVWSQTGYNLTWATSMPAVAIAMAPVTAVSGAVVAYNVAALIAPALSAWTAYLLCWELTASPKGALAGGLIYGFSPYEVAHVLSGHLVITTNFIPPLCVLLTLLLIENKIPSARYVFTFGLTLVLQFLISSETLATMTLFGAIALLTAALTLGDIWPRLKPALAPIGLAYVVAAIILAPVLYYAFVKGSPPQAPIFPTSFFSADLLSFLVPGQLMLTHLLGSDRVAARFAGNIWENGSYLSIPLLAVAGLWFWPRRREGDARLLALLVAIVLIAALGPILHVGGRQIVCLPWTLARRIPLMRHALPVRLINYAFLILAIIISNWLSGPPVAFRKVMVTITVIALFPNPAFLFHQSRYDNPPFFSKGLYRHYLRRGENVLVIPFGRSGPSMAWQAESWMYFRMPGGHLSTTPEDFSRWPVANTLLTSLPVPNPGAQFAAFVQAYGVEAVVVADGASKAARELPALLGVSSLKAGGVLLYNLQPSRREPSVAEIETLQWTAAEEWFVSMLCTARRFIADGGELAALEPAKAQELGLLPHSEWSDNLDLLIAGLPHGANNGLWVGPGEGGTIAVGLPASGSAARALVARYRTKATSILYPYPQPYSNAAIPDDVVRFLLLTLRPSALACCRNLHTAVIGGNETTDSDGTAGARWLSR